MKIPSNLIKKNREIFLNKTGTGYAIVTPDWNLQHNLNKTEEIYKVVSPIDKIKLYNKAGLWDVNTVASQDMRPPAIEHDTTQCPFVLITAERLRELVTHAEKNDCRYYTQFVGFDLTNSKAMVCSEWFILHSDVVVRNQTPATDHHTRADIRMVPVEAMKALLLATGKTALISISFRDGHATVQTADGTLLATKLMAGTMPPVENFYTGSSVSKIADPIASISSPGEQIRDQKADLVFGNSKRSIHLDRWSMFSKIVEIACGVRTPYPNILEFTTALRSKLVIAAIPEEE